MDFRSTRQQLDEVYERSIRANFSVSQNPPSITSGTQPEIGSLRSTAIAMKNIDYDSMYSELESNNQYHLKLIDGSLLIFQYTFNSAQELIKHRLCFLPCPKLPTAEEAPELYERDELYGDIVTKRIVRFPIRFDFDPDNHKSPYHPKSHVTLGQFDNCRIPATHPVAPHPFLIFIARNFYFRLFKKNQNIFEKRPKPCNTAACISLEESRLTNISVRS